ncbi:MAG: DUF262 domain-containing HNH endonuclease family protein [Acidobacteriota bacterium]|nr:DUF262 domain-containing HNH endonuclease family protein [Acidobacteriota bacterium]
MARSNVLNTRTTNFLELLGNGRNYRVPPYQRDYSWEEEQWEDLWSDIQELRGNSEERHYMGALVVEGTSDREFRIIDGQQRLASLSLLALAVIAKLKDLADAGLEAEANRERAAALRTRFIGEKDPASLIESSKLFLNETDNSFYQDYLVQLRPPLNPRGLTKSSNLLWECYKYFRNNLDKIPEYSKGKPLAELISEIVGRQLLFILITVENDINAYMVFETLNARGLELTTTDLLKNYLFSRVKVESDLQALQRRWRTMLATIRQERFPEFLRYHLLCQHSKIRSQRLFKLVRAQAQSPEEVFQLLTELESRAELFAALSDPNHGYWAETPEARPYIRELTLYRVKQMTPLLFAVYERFDRSDFVRVLRLVSILSLRYSIVCRLNTNALEPTYHQAAKAVLDGTATTPAHVFRELKSIYVDDAMFEQNFAILELDTGQRKKLAKYFLARFECDHSGRACDPDTDPASIEHILPENPSEEWAEHFPSEHWEKNIYRLGNLTLLEPSANRRVGNLAYAEKLRAYLSSAYSLTKEIVEMAPEYWTPDIMARRQKEMAQRAVHLWRSEFA